MELHCNNSEEISPAHMNLVVTNYFLVGPNCDMM
jgi:hypothetical protein